MVERVAALGHDQLTDAVTRNLGGWSTPAFWALRPMRRIRGTPLDVFGWAHVRHVEREMIPEYISAIGALLPLVDAYSLAEVVAIASLPDRVRGYEHLKLERASAYREELSRRIAALTSKSPATTN